MLVAATPLAAVEADSAPTTLEEAKALGRENSNYLKATNQETKAAAAVPKANVAHFQKTIKHILGMADRIVPGHFPELIKRGDQFVWDEPAELALLVR